MNLQGRNLLLQFPPLQGDDVKLLQRELQQLGLTLRPDEIAQGTFGPGTRDAVQKFQDKFAAELRASGWPGEVGVVEAVTAQIINREVDRLNPPANSFAVRGQVRRADGKGLVDVTVVASDRDLRSEQLLGTATTDADGHYEIRYTTEQFRRAETASADLTFHLSQAGVSLRDFAAFDSAGAPLDTVSVRDASGTATSILVKFNAEPEEIVDFIVADTAGLPSEYERLLQKLRAPLEDLDVPGAPAPSVLARLALVTPEDIEFLSKETGIEREKIELLAMAARREQQAAAPDGVVPAEAFYGLAREGLPTELQGLALRSDQELRDALQRTLDDNIVPAALRASLSIVLERLRRLCVDQILRTPSAQGRPAGSDLLSLALPQPERQAALLVAHANRGDQSIEEFWKSLRAQPQFKDQVDALQLNMQLAALTQNHTALMQTIQQAMHIASARDLAKLDAAAWTDLLKRQQPNGEAIGLPHGIDIPGDNEDEKTKNYVNSLVSAVQTAFPTDAIAQIVAGASGDDIRIEQRVQRDVTRFFTNSPDFDVYASIVDNYVAEHAATAFTGIPEADRVPVTEQVKRIQRLSRVSTGPDTLRGLLRSGLDSAHAIANMPRSAFIARHKDVLGGEESASDVHNRASAINARSLHLWISLNEALNEPQTPATGMDAEAAEEMVRKHVPNYAELFGSLDFCMCDDCRSVLSPAAYLVDLLEFLRNSAPNKQGKTPLDFLVGDGRQIGGRRPDIAHIPLTCENTNTALPYVDLVNEVLEFFVANRKLDKDAAHDTADSTTDDLRANPQFIIPAAYAELKRSVYPLSLPYDQPLDAARVYLDHLGTNRAQIMETFRKGSSPSDLQIACEYLRISPTDTAVLVGTDPHGLIDFYYDPDHQPGNLADLVARLAPAREFLQQTGLDYADLLELLGTRFVNPRQGTAQGLRLETPASRPNPDDSTRPIPVSPCDLERTTISNLDAPTLTKMHRFIRLWRKLGWTMRDLDRALSALGTADINAVFLQRLADVNKLQADLRLPSLQVLLSLWANIETHGDDALYGKLFLNKSALSLDDKFVLNASGTELKGAGPSLKISDHSPALLAGLRISAIDLSAARDDAGLADDPSGNPPTFAPLNLASISALYRYAVLSRALKLRIADLIALKTLSNVDPFSTPDQTVRFVDIHEKLQRARFKLAQLDYLYRNVSHPPEDLAPQRNEVLSIARTLREGLLRIDTEHRIAEDPAGELTRAKLGLIFEPVVVDQTMGMIDGTAIYTTALASIPSNLTFPAAVKNKIAVDENAKLLRFEGPMSSAERSALLGHSIDAAIDDLHRQPRDFVRDVLAGFLDPSQAINALLETSSLDPDRKPLASVIADKFAFVLAGLVPFVRDRLGRSLIKQAFGDALELDSDVIDLVVETILKSRSDASQPAIDDAATLRRVGLAASYFSTIDLTGSSTERLDAVLAFDGTGAGVGAVPAGTRSARWSGFVASQDNAAYSLHVRASGDVKVWLGDLTRPVIDAARAQASAGVSSDPVALRTGELAVLRVEVRDLRVAQGAASAMAELRWSSPTLAKEIVPAAALYPASVIDNFAAAFTLLHKAALLIATLKLSAKELAYLHAHASDFAGTDPGNPQDTAPFDLNALPMSGAQFKPALLNQLERLVDFASLRESLPQGEVTLIDVFATASAPNSGVADVRTRLVAATGWDASVVDALIAPRIFDFGPADLKDERSLLRLQACVGLCKRLGVEPGTILRWASQAPDSDQAQAIKKAAKAKHDDKSWLAVAKPLADVLREQQRSALVAYLVPRLDKIDSNELFEFFLIDVDMTSCMMTSRVKQAISSVQLFVQRCLLNLEQTDVAPAQIDAEQWQWMKNYRVWEANRKIFLYPENWLAPALLDFKSPFFKELESELLQDEVTADTVETAFQHYVEKLDQVARLEICAMYWQDKDPDTGREINVLHVFGRTLHTPHIYFYRQLVNGTTWTPWEKLQLDIQSVDEGERTGVHLIPVVWNRRLHLYWPIFSVKPDESQDLRNPTPESDAHKEWRKKRDQYYGKDYPDYLRAKAEYTRQEDEWTGQHNLWLMRLAWFRFTHPNLPPDAVDPNDPEPPKPPEPHEPDGPGPEPEEFTGEAHPAKAHLEVKLAWSEYQHGKWSPKQVSGETFRFSGSRAPSSIHFKAMMDRDELVIRLFTSGKLLKAIFVIESVEFRFSGCARDLSVESWSPAPMMLPQKNTVPVFMTFEEKTTPRAGTLSLFTGDFGDKPLPSVQTLNARRELNLLGRTPSPYNIVYPHQFHQFAVQAPFFYQDRLRTFFVTPANTIDFLRDLPNAGKAELSPLFGTDSLRVTPDRFSVSESIRALVNPEPAALHWSQAGAASDRNWAGTAGAALPITKRLRFETFRHPFVCDFVKSLKREGVRGLLTIDNQQLHEKDVLSVGKLRADVGTIFERQYKPTDRVTKPYPVDDIDFDYAAAYSLYNWELFFHIPLLIATRLSQNLQFAEAQRWLHYIFDPTNSAAHEEAPQRYWQVLPFKTTRRQRLEDLLLALNAGNNDLMRQVEQWRHHPFRPHLIARLRLIAYQKCVVMMYIQHLIDWADQLFRQDSIESINEAMQFYVLAAKLLGTRPQQIPPQTVAAETYAELAKNKLDAFSNALVDLENRPGALVVTSEEASESSGLLGLGRTLYFCAPRNDKLLGYWDIVADRLFKIRHCMNIEGVVRELPLFEPPIEPGLLVQAVAKGVDLGSVLRDLNAPLPHYRFHYLLQKALDLCADLKSLGSALLSALEKKDGEHLALLQATQELRMLREQVRRIKETQIVEANETVVGLRKSRIVIETRHDYYKNIEFLNEWEAVHLALTAVTGILQTAAQLSEIAAGAAYFTPDSYFGSAGSMGSPLAFSHFAGGSKSGAGLQSFGRAMNVLAAVTGTAASISGTMGGYQRRSDDWKLQETLAQKELDQIDQQILAAQTRAQIATFELESHDKQIEHSEAIADYLRDKKYSNEELYAWMQGEVSTIYFQCYQMAYDLAKKAEKAFRFERGLTSSNFIQFGYWDSLRKGLLSGERLYLALKQMESAYLEQNKREYEITKHVSLVQFDPLALIALKETGECIVELPESLFDMDYPGHYMRRIKIVSLTIPCVAGPYTGVSCTLTLLTNKTRIKPTPTDPYAESPDGEDPRFVSNFAATQSIATSTAQNDAGLFELNFRDERYLPFEGAGVISRWRLELNGAFRQFDYETITDVILHIRYTAREGGEPLKTKAIAALETAIKEQTDGDAPLFRLFSLRHEFPSEWQKLLMPASQADADPVVRSVDVVLAKDRFPFYLAPATLQPQAVYVVAVPRAGAALQPFTLSLTAGKGTGDAIAFDLVPQANPAFGSALFARSSDQISLPEVDVNPTKAIWGINVSLHIDFCINNAIIVAVPTVQHGGQPSCVPAARQQCWKHAGGRPWRS